MDDFPNDKNVWIDSDNDGLADSNPYEFDIDGDGITDTLNSDIEGWNVDANNDGIIDIIVLDDEIERKPQPINIKEAEEKNISSFALDLGIPLMREALFSLDFYTQYAALIRKNYLPNNRGFTCRNRIRTNSIRTFSKIWSCIIQSRV